ncbi:MAG: VCBS repeat-containing protein [Ignavibacteriae bacterium]|nr:VCBS repeat-containing protein [Ignavibacteriota bacterium]
MTSTKLLLLVLFSGTTFAQQLSHPIMSSRGDARTEPRASRVFADTIDVLAVAVQFQADNEPRTSGNGQLDLSTPAEVGFDSPPRNLQYFLDHLTFLGNYYRKVSKGRVVIRATLVDSVFTLASQMSRYSPPKSGPNTAVGDLARDAWNKVDSSGRVADFSQFECFVVFHAGVGRDVDIAGTIGYDPTPLDIPSLYIGLNAFKSFYGASYEGIPLRGGFKITNTIIIPETETRTIPATPSDVTLRLGINGLLCASVGNFLGLPDLFDTNTGRSGIGRFGLMDGQAIFSFAGVFPPEPSAWEKYWLGWIQPITLSSGDHQLAMPAASVDSARVYHIPISGSEYYLMENRHRDAARNGQRITSSYGGVIRQQTFLRDTADFNAFDLDLIKGNVTDVEDFDWSLPGGVSTSGEFFDGGILIWHIDEAVIARGLATNGVNADPEYRGIDLEEADGSQDIGQQYGQLEAGSGSEEGTALDFWYQGNISPVSIGEFSSRSHPSNTSNAGANSHIIIKEFSARGPSMTARVVVGDGQVALLEGFPKTLQNKANDISLTVADLGAAIGTSILVSTGPEPTSSPRRVSTSGSSAIFAWNLRGNGVLRSDGTFVIAQSLAPGFLNSVAVRDLNQDSIAEVVTGAMFQQGILTNIAAYSSRSGSGDSLAQQYFSRLAGFPFSTSPMIGDSIIAIGGSHGLLLFYEFTGVRLDSFPRFADSVSVVGVSKISDRKATVVTTTDGTIDIVYPGVAVQPPTARNYGKRIAGPAAVGIFGSEERIAFATIDGDLYALNRLLQPVPGFPVRTSSAVVHPPALADINGDGNRDIIVFAGNRIHAYNFAGASLDNFPKLIPSSNSITSNPVVGDVDGDGDVDIVAVTSNGVVVAYDKNGSMAQGFPLQAGTGNQSVALFTFPLPALSATGIGVAVASAEDGTVTAWRTGSVTGNRAPNFPWPQYQHDAQHTGLATEPLTGTPVSAEFFPKERAYNWPNPVYDGKTFIRYFIKENANVKIKILDLAGDLVTEFAAPGVGGVDNEVEWNVAGVQSGVYLARIEATGGGNTAVAIVKVAVVK